LFIIGIYKHYTETMPKKKTKALIWKKFLAAALATITIGGAASVHPYFRGEKVVEVVDGDTIILENRQPIRLYGLNAPELSYCLGSEAKEALTKLTLGKRVYIREPLSDGRGRVMALIYNKEGLLANEAMVRSGLSQYKRQGGSETKRLKEASDYARENHIGIYSPTCYQTEPPNPRCTIKGNHDEHTGRAYYFSTACNYYSLVTVQKHQGDNWFCTEKEAKDAGFTKSPDCN
jgi:endonuclease YncB( thermonuclease family)